MIPIITIDGPSGTGKGTVAYLLAHKLKWNYLDSGLIYRVIAYILKKKDINPANILQILDLITQVKVDFVVKDNSKILVLWNNEDVYDIIRSEECGQYASQIASVPEIRKALLSWQYTFVKVPGLVTDGRDMGTVVFPKANLKIFLEASTEVRAHRRYLQLQDSGKCVSLHEVLVELVERDNRDKNRSCSPLMPAEDAYIIDTSDMDVRAVFDKVLQLVQDNGLIELGGAFSF